MKDFLKKVFFFDRPAQGAFAGTTLLLVSLWLGPALFLLCGELANCNAPISQFWQLLFLLPVNFKERQFTLKWSEAMQGIEWGTLILFGGGLAMGGMMYKTGLSQWVGDLIVSSMGGAPSEVAMVAIFSVMALLLSELTSHTAATNMIGPLAITAAISAGISPVPVSVGIALSASLGFMLPVSTPPNAIVYASGYIPITKMIKTGVYIDFIGIACVTIPLAIYFVNWITGM